MSKSKPSPEGPSRIAAPPGARPAKTSTWDPTTFWNSDLATAFHTLCRRQWGWGWSDPHLSTAIDHALASIKGVGVVARYRDLSATFSYFTRRDEDGAPVLAFDQGETIAEAAAELLAAPKSAPVIQSRGHHSFPYEGYLVIVSPVPERPDGTQLQDYLRGCDYCCVIFHRSDDPASRSAEESRVVDGVARTFPSLLYHLIRQRVQVFAPFPNRISERYWITLCKANGHGRELFPPWGKTIPSRDKTQPVRTATLSYDLRKSTFCMEQADNLREFSLWMDQLVQILTRVAHLHGGVFDKFTGDGALVHFLEEECRTVYEIGSVQAALACAVDMQQATSIHLDRLRPFLRINSKLFGAGIGIDVANALWSPDHRGNPIVVGRGVVGACRIGDRTKGGRIRLTQIAFESIDLRSRRDHGVREVLFESKEFSKDMKLTVWEFKRLPSGVGSPFETIRDLCASIHAASPTPPTAAADGPT